MKKPNIILFITHDQGQFLGCYDTPTTPNSLQTPNIDKLAKDGIRFTNYFCTAPQCSPSRGSILTSLYPHQHGLMGLVNRGWSLPDSNKTLPMFLRERGYSTHLVGLQHETNNPVCLGYNTISKRVRDYKYNTNKLDNQFIEFLKHHKNDSKPFYANFGTIETHRPFSAWADPVQPDAVKIPYFLPDHELIRKDLAEFYGTIHRVDDTIGKIIGCLEDLNLIENTLFIYTTDHGSAFPRAKCTLYDSGIKTLLLMHHSSSEMFSGGKVFNQMISNIDLLPTLISSVNGKISTNIEGKSFLSLLKEENGSIRSKIFTEKTYHELYDPIRGIRTERYKYIYNFEKLDTLYQMPLDILRGYSGEYMKHKYNSPRDQIELYDLHKDPNETTNLINDLEYKNIGNELKEDLFEWLRRTNDPILHGKVIPQKGINFKYN